jgi:gliding-associated putative ABC transporter substrate-binding component GldG
MKRDWTTRSSIVLIGVIIVVINLIGLTIFGRLDLTDDNVYSLSDASIKLAQELDDPVTFKAFFTDDLPAPYSSNRRFLKDKLDDYRAYGGSNVQYRFIDPGQDEEVAEEARRFRIPPVQIQVIEKDNVQLKNAYMGMSIEYGGEREVIPVVQDLSTLEYDITSAIRRLTRDELPTVGFLTGHGEPNVFQDMPALRQGLGRNYEVVEVNVVDSTLDRVPDALLVIAPTDTLPDLHLRAIDSYVMEGGRLGLMLNTVSADLQAGQATAQSVGLDPVLESYGVSLKTDLVTDLQSSAVTVQQQSGFFNIARQIEYPFFPIATRFNPDNLMVSRLREVVFYFVSSVDTAATLPAGVQVEPLVYSTARSATQEGFFFIQPMMEGRPDYRDGPFILSAAYTGTFPSAYDPFRESVSSRIVVVGDGDFINESVLGRIPGNIEFGLNMVDWLVQESDLLTIRSKKIEPRALREVNESLRPWIKYGNMLAPALLIVVFGLVRWRRRDARQFVMRDSVER